MLYLLVLSWPKCAKRRKFTRLFEQVRQGQFNPNEAGVIELHWYNRHLTKEGRIYVTRHEDLLMVLFPLWVGKGSNQRGVLMCSRALTETDTQLEWYFGKQERIVTIFAHGMWGHYDGQSAYFVPLAERKADVVLGKEVWPYSYLVSNDLS